jgi:programmed cell death protein 5
MDGSGGMPSVEEMQMRQQQQQENEARRLSILDQILEPAAKSRLSRLAMVKKEHARSVEDSLINAATNGQLKSKISEEQLIAMLEQISGSAASGTSQNRGITIQRRKTGFDDDEEDDDDSDLA